MQKSSSNSESENQDQMVDDIYEDSNPPDKYPYNLQILRNRRETSDILQNCENVRQSVINKSRDRRTNMSNPIKKLVSKQKYRFNIDGFNLDLTYITDQIIAMGFPALDYEKIYRNSMEDVIKFFKTRHDGHYLIINLCSERKYDHAYFDNNVLEFPFDDHQAPTMELIYSMCLALDQFLQKSPLNVAAIHCKAGKGRTGVMICCYLLHSKLFHNSYDSMRYYGAMRTSNRKGVTIPSQIRYVLYYELALNNNWRLQDIPVQPYRIRSIRVVTVPSLNYDGACDPWLDIKCGGLTHTITQDHKVSQSDGCINFELDTYVQSDVQVLFWNSPLLKKFQIIIIVGFKKRKEKMFSFWFNTSFIDESGVYVIDKLMLDGAVKDKSHKKYSPHLRVEIGGVPMFHPSVNQYSLDRSNSQISSDFLDHK